MSYTLVGQNGNAFHVISYVTKAMKECEYTQEELKQYRQQAMSSDYNNLICVSMLMLDKLNKEKA